MHVRTCMYKVYFYIRTYVCILEHGYYRVGVVSVA